MLHWIDRWFGPPGNEAHAFPGFRKRRHDHGISPEDIPKNLYEDIGIDSFGKIISNYSDGIQSIRSKLKTKNARLMIDDKDGNPVLSLIARPASRCVARRTPPSPSAWRRSG